MKPKISKKWLFCLVPNTYFVFGESWCGLFLAIAIASLICREPEAHAVGASLLPAAEIGIWQCNARKSDWGNVWRDNSVGLHRRISGNLAGLERKTSLLKQLGRKYAAPNFYANLAKRQTYVRTGKRGVGVWEEWWPETESNCRHEDFQSSALPTELSGRGIF